MSGGIEQYDQMSDGTSCPSQASLLRVTCMATCVHSHLPSHAIPCLSGRWTVHALGFTLQFLNNFTGTKHSMIINPLQGVQPEGSSQGEYKGLLVWSVQAVGTGEQTTEQYREQHHCQHPRTTQTSMTSHHAAPSARTGDTRAGNTAPQPYLVLLCISYFYFLSIKS